MNLLIDSQFSLFFMYILSLLLAIMLHEISHAIVAYALGDDTAKRAGRFKLHTHFDLYGSLLIPLLLYFVHSPIMLGYAKPVPVDSRKFKKPRVDMALVAAAGPLCNFLLAAIGAWALSCVGYNITAKQTLCYCLFNFTVVNLALCFFNLIPIPPLDGSRIISAMVSDDIARKMQKIEPFGFFIIIGIEVICSQLSSLLGYKIGLSAMIYGLIKKTLLVPVFGC
jgi:Zn-dependent protease